LAVAGDKLSALLREARLEYLESIQRKFATALKIVDGSRTLVQEVSVHVVRPKSMAGVLFLFSDLVVLAATKGKGYQKLVATPVVSFRFINGRPTPESLYLIAEDKEFLVQFADTDDKRTWMAPFVELRKECFDAIKLGDTSFIRWSDVTIGGTVAPVMNHDGCSCGAELLFFGGTNASLADGNSCVLYNYNAGSWEALASKVPPRNSHTVTFCNKGAYVMFGQRKKEVLNDIWKWDCARREWSKVQTTGQTPTGRFGHSCVAVGEKLYIFGGKNDGGHYLADLSVFNMQDRSYKVLTCTNAPSARSFHSCVALGQKTLVVIGGRTAQAIVGDVHVFDIAKSHWTEINLQIGPRMYHRCGVVGRMLVVIGGIHDSDFVMIDTNWWEAIDCTEYGNIPHGLSRFALVEISSGLLLVFGGSDATSRSPALCSYLLDARDSIFESPTPQRRKRVMSAAAHRSPAALVKPKTPGAKPRRWTTNAGALKVGPTRHFLVGAACDADDVLRELPIDITGLRPFEQEAAKRKAKRYWSLRDENNKLQDRIAKMEMVAAGDVGLPPNSPLLLKLFDDATGRTQILKLTSNHGADDIAETVREVVEREALLCVYISRAKAAQLNEDNLLLAHGSICTGEQAALVILAL
jgi:hypothetical protein